jgi:hypothetical protein
VFQLKLKRRTDTFCSRWQKEPHHSGTGTGHCFLNFRVRQAVPEGKRTRQKLFRPVTTLAFVELEIVRYMF